MNRTNGTTQPLPRPNRPRRGALPSNDKAERAIGRAIQVSENVSVDKDHKAIADRPKSLPPGHVPSRNGSPPWTLLTGSDSGCGISNAGHAGFPSRSLWESEADLERVLPAISGNHTCGTQPFRPDSVTQPSHNDPLAPLALLEPYEQPWHDEDLTTSESIARPIVVLYPLLGRSRPTWIRLWWARSFPRENSLWPSPTTMLGWPMAEA